MSGAYRKGLRQIVGGAAVPYGYTLVIATSVGVLMRTHGAPTSGDAFLLLAGAVLGFAGVALASGSGPETHGVTPETHGVTRDIDRLWVGVSSALAAAVGLGLAVLVTDGVGGPGAFGLVGLITTVAYFAIGAAGVALIERRSDRAQDQRARTPT